MTRRVWEQMPVMLAALGPYHRVVVWNQECEAVTGYAAAEILGSHDVFLRLFPDPAYREQLRTAYQNSDGGFGIGWSASRVKMERSKRSPSRVWVGQSPSWSGGNGASRSI